MRPRTKVAIGLAIMLVLLWTMAIVFVHVLWRPSRVPLFALDAFLMALMSMPFIGHALHGSTLRSPSQKVAIILAPLLLVTLALAVGFVGFPRLGLAAGAAAFLTANGYYFICSRSI